MNLGAESHTQYVVCPEAPVVLKLTDLIVPEGYWLYRGTSFIRNYASLGPYSRIMPRDLGGS